MGEKASASKAANSLVEYFNATNKQRPPIVLLADEVRVIELHVLHVLTCTCITCINMYMYIHFMQSSWTCCVIRISLSYITYLSGLVVPTLNY